MEIKVNGVTLHYEVVGHGEPLIMTHGNGENHEIFREAAVILKQYFTVYLVDSRGHGKSSPVREYHYQDMANDLKEMIQTLNLKNVTFYGFSDGGILGLLLASQTRLCRQYILSGANSQTDGVSRTLLLIMHFSTLFGKKPLTELMLREPHIPDEELKKICDEVDLIAGEHDLILERHTSHLHRVIPGSRMEILPGEDHGSYIVHNAKLAELILKYTHING